MVADDAIDINIGFKPFVTAVDNESFMAMMCYNLCYVTS